MTNVVINSGSRRASNGDGANGAGAERSGKARSFRGSARPTSLPAPPNNATEQDVTPERLLTMTDDEV